MELRPYQAEAKQAILSEWSEGHKKTLLVLCTGLGKTIVFSSVTEHQVNLGHRVLIMAHRGELLSQAAEKLKAASNLDAAFEQGDSHSLGSFLPVTVGSVQSLSQEKRLDMFPQDYFQDIIVDEAHHCLSDSYQRVLEHFPDANILGVTATPDRGDKQTLGQFFDSLAYEYPMRRAIREKYLAPIKAQLIPLKLDISPAKMANGDFSANDIGYALESYLYEIAAHMKNYCRGHKTVVFLPLVATSQKFCQILREFGMRSAEVNGDSTNRTAILTDFENGKYDVLCNSMLLTEGWDCPAVDCIVVLRPTKIRSLYQQMVGRGMRLSPGKENLLLLDFLWMTERYDLCKPSSIIAKDEKIAETIDDMLKKTNGEVDLIDAEEQAERDALKEREATLAKQLEEMRSKKKKLVDPIQYALSIAAEDLASYTPTFPWEMAPPTEKQLLLLENRGILPDTVKNAGYASLLIDRLKMRQAEGLATPKQIRCLEEFTLDNNILSALKSLDVSSLSRADWIQVGMALKEEGYPCSIWDDWSRNDTRYHAGECEKKWAGFNDDRVGYVTGDVWQDGEGKWLPSNGVYDRTAGELISSLKKHKDDIGATVGDWKPEVGGWIRFNPLDGDGVKNENVTKFKFALVESDTLPIVEQDAIFRKLELPIVALVHSGGKSLHAIVRVDADNYEEYRKRVEFLYDFLEKQGVAIDKQNRNPSRLSRMPGLTRNGNRQYLAATNIGRKSWTDWMDFVEGVTDELPSMVSLAEGTKWLGFPCRKGRVLYVNLEIDPASCIFRFLKIYDALGLPMNNADNISNWNLRGHAVPLDQLVPKLVRRVRGEHLDAIYKVITGDENKASEMGQFCNQFDKICTETGCSTIYCHHHSKGAQGNKRAMDRASGSGVFSRDPDAQLDMIQLELDDDIKNNVRDGYATAWRLESNLREFENIKPVNFWFEYPIHRLDTDGTLGEMPAQGTLEAGRKKNGYSKTAEVCADEFRNAYQALNMDGNVTVQDMMEYLNISDKTVYARLKKMGGEFVLKKGKIYRSTPVTTGNEADL